MTDETAFFEFGTNLNEVVSTIEAGMQRVNSAVSGGVRLNPGALKRDTAALSDTFTNLEANLTASQGRIKELASKVGSGAINATEFRTGVRKEIKGALEGIPQVMAESLSLAPGTTAKRINASEIARLVGQDYVTGLSRTVRELRPQFRAALDFEGQIEKLAKNPVAYGKESTDNRLAQLTNQIRAEELLAQSVKKGGINPATLEQSGFKPLFDQLQKEATAEGRYGTPNSKGTGGFFVPSDAKAELGEVTREMKALGKETATTRTETTRLAAAEKEAGAEQSGGFVGGLLSRFHRGNQDVLTNLGAQVGSAAGFTLAYGALFSLQHAVSDTVHEFQDYQDSLTDLQVATRDTDVVTASFVNRLGELARVSGANVGAALDTAARGIRAFGSGADPSQLQAIGEATNAAATKLALIADKTLPDATGDLIASGSAFGLGPNQLNEVVDAVANAKRNVGGDAKQISQGLALIAGGAQEAGFSLNEAAAVIGLVQARTDQTGQAIATRLTRIFQIVSGSTGKGLAKEFGIDPNASVKTQIEKYAQIYATGSEAQKDRITSALGGTANLRELLPLLKENTILQNAYASALSNAGQGTNEFNRKSDNLVGTLKKIKGDISGIQVQASISGIAAPLGEAVRVAEPLLHLVDRILQGYNQLPEPLRVSLGILLDILAASKAIAVVQAASGARGVEGAVFQGAAEIVGDKAARKAVANAGKEIVEEAVAAAAAARAATGSRLAAEEAFNTSIAAAMARRVEVETVGTVAIGEANTANAVASELGAAGGLLGRGAARGGVAAGAARLGEFATNPYVLGTALLIGTGLIVNKALDGRAQRSGFLGTNASSQAGLGTIDLVNTAQDLKQASQDLHSASGNVKKSKSNFFSSDTQDDVASVLEGQSKTLRKFASDAAREQSELARKTDKGVFGNGAIQTVSQLSDAITALQDAGAGAITIMHKVGQALRDPGPKTGQIARLDDLADVFATSLNADLSKILPDGKIKVTNPYFNQSGGPVISGGREVYSRPGASQFLELNKNEAIKSLALNGDELAKAKQAFLDEAARRDIKSGDHITDAQIDSLAAYAAEKVNPFKDVVDASAQLQSKWYELIRERLGGGNLQGPDAINKFIGDTTGLPTGTKAQLDLINGKGKLSGGQLGALFETPEGQPGLLQSLYSNALSGVPKSDDGTKLRSVQAYWVGVFRDLIKRGGKDTPQTFIEFYNNMVHDLAQSKIDQLEDLRKAAQNKKGLSAKQILNAGAQSLLQEIQQAGTDENLLKALMLNADQQVLALVRAHLQRAADIANAAQAGEIELMGIKAFIFGTPGKTGPQKALDLFDKNKGGLNIPDKGSVYSTGSDAANYDPSKNPTKTAAEVKAERIRYLNALDQLKGDLTDPVEQARDALRAARRAVTAATTNADREEARVDVRRSRNELESAKFTQRLSDAQIADELGRKSHTAYIQYLENEHNRLNAIKKRTRQQQDELNQVDLALKDAKGALDGQFNLGDINTNGLVYQVRRQVAEARATAASSSLAANTVTSQQTVSISINGADTAKVKQILSQYLNISASQTNTLVRRKV